MAVTPGRTTVVELDCATIDNTQVCAYWHELAMEQISKGSTDNPPRIVLLPEIGWQIATYNSFASYIHEGTEADTGMIPVSTPSGLTTFSIFKRPDDLPGVGGGGLKVTGDDFYHKRVSQSDDWDNSNYILSADQASYPGPDTASDNISMDRVAVGDENHLPTDKITFRFFVPGIEGGAKQTVISLYFSGISTRTFREFQSSPSIQGTGQYCIKLYGDGQAKLWERMSNETWRVRKNMVWTPSSKVCGNWHYVTIASDARFDGTTYVGTRIGFQFQSIGNFIEASVGLAVAAIGGPEWQFYKPDRVEAGGTSLAPIRIDVRRDVRAVFQPSKAVHFPEAELVTVIIGMPYIPLDDTDPIRFEWYGDKPSSTTVSIAMYDAEDDAALVVVDPGASYLDKGYATFKPVKYHSRYYAILTLTSSGDGMITPTIKSVDLLRDPTFSVGIATPFEVENKDEISITGPSADPSHETASLAIHDRSGNTYPLFFRAGMPMRIEVKYDPDDPTLTSTLFQGRIAQAVTDRRHRKRTRGFGQIAKAESNIWRSYRTTAMGEWQRLYELQLPKPFNLGEDRNYFGFSVPYKVTDVIRILLESHYPVSMVDVPNNETRLMTGVNNSWIIEVHEPIGPLIQDLARNYLGGWLVFDSNASNGGDPGNKFGCWRLKVPPRPPYTSLAEFVFEPNFAGPRSGVNLENYVPTTDGDQTIKRVFVRFGTMREWVVPPEGNVVYVQGGTPDGSALGATAGATELLQAQAINFDSAKFFEDQDDPDPTHPDFLGRVVPIFHSDPGLYSKNAVSLMCRRIFDIACHAQKRVSFEAPLVLIEEASDALQTRPRKLQFGDPVIFGGEQFIVDSCDVDYRFREGGDRRQMAQYELFSVPSLTNYDVNTENMIQTALSLFT